MKFKVRKDLKGFSKESTFWARLQTTDWLANASVSLFPPAVDVGVEAMISNYTEERLERSIPLVL